MSSSLDDDRIQACELCGEDKGLCDQPGLRDGMFFTMKLYEDFDISTVRNDDNYFFVIKQDFCFFPSTHNFFLYNSTSSSPVMQDGISWRGLVSKSTRVSR
jgi:hypothetical protein